MTFFAIVGYGPNDLEIPLVIFQSREEAEAYMYRLPVHDGGYLDDDFSEKEGIYEDEEDDECMSELGRGLYPLLFKNGNYYSGCGACYRIAVVEYEFGKPMVGWDLDWL